MRNLLIAVMALFVAAAGFSIASAAEHSTTGYSIKKVEAEFDDVFSELQDVVVNKGLVIDLVGHVDKMLMRTAEAAGSVTEEGSKSPYINAKYVLFCSAKLTQSAVSASAENLGICPYIVFAYEAKAEPGVARIGYRLPILGKSRTSKRISAEITEFLQSILDDTAKGF